MKTKIFIIIDNLAAGGTQRQIIEYLKCADCEKFIIKIISLDTASNLLAKDVSDLGYEVIEIDHKGFFNLSTIIKLVNLFIKEKPDIVHTYLYTADFYGRLAAKLAGVKIIISSVRNIQLWKKWHHILADRILAKFTDKITINAERIRLFLVKKERIDPEKIITIYNGKDLQRFKNLRRAEEIRKELGIPNDALVIGMVARFSEQKDYGTFFTAAKKIIKDMPGVYFIAAGDGPEKEMFESRYTNHNMIFTGFRRDVPELINTMDICVLSSHYEGCPNAILEYMAAGKPAVATDVGGCSELVADGETGFIVPPGDPSYLVGKLINLLESKDLRMEMGKAARVRVETKFSLEEMVRGTEHLYQELYISKQRVPHKALVGGAA